MLPPFTYKSELFEYASISLCRVWLHQDCFEKKLEVTENQYHFGDKTPLLVNPEWHPNYLGSFLASRIGCLLLWGFIPEKDASQKLKVPGFGSLSHTKVQDTYLALVARCSSGPVGVDIQAKSMPNWQIQRALARVGIQAEQRLWFEWGAREVKVKAKITRIHLLFEDESRCEVIGF